LHSVLRCDSDGRGILPFSFLAGCSLARITVFLLLLVVRVGHVNSKVSRFFSWGVFSSFSLTVSPVFEIGSLPFPLTFLPGMTVIFPFFSRSPHLLFPKFVSGGPPFHAVEPPTTFWQLEWGFPQPLAGRDPWQVGFPPKDFVAKAVASRFVVSPTPVLGPPADLDPLLILKPGSLAFLDPQSNSKISF